MQMAKKQELKRETRVGWVKIIIDTNLRYNVGKVINNTNIKLAITKTINNNNAKSTIRWANDNTNTGTDMNRSCELSRFINNTN